MGRERAVNGSGIQPHKRADGRWEARFKTGIDPRTGKALYKSIYAKTSGECSRALRAATAAVDAGTYMDASKSPLGEWLDIWLNEYNRSIKERTRNTYRGTIETRIKPGLGAIPLCALQPHMVQRFINSLIDLSPKTVKNVHGILHHALDKAVQMRYIARNPADGCSLPRIVKQEMQFLAGDDVKCFIDAVKGHKYERLFLTALFTGMREGELLGLCWDSVNLERETILINRQLQLIKGEYKLLPTKNSKPRTITLTGYVTDMLSRQRALQREWQLKAGAAWSNPEGFVFTDESGRHIARSTMYGSFKRLLRSAGLPERLRFHDLRHSYAVFALNSGDSPKELQEALGHYSAAFTLDTYAHVSEQAALASAARRDAAIQALGR